MVRLNKSERQDKRELLASLNQVDSLGKPIDNEAFENCHEHLEGASNSNDTDLLFLTGLLNSTAVTQLIKIQKNFDEEPVEVIEPELLGVSDILSEVGQHCARSWKPEARELLKIIRNPHVKAVCDTHDRVGRNFEEYREKQNIQPIVRDVPEGDLLNNDMPVETIKMVCLRRNPNEPLGLTVEIDEHKQLMVARIIAGGMIDRQGLLNPGDVILEVNGVPVSTPEELQAQISVAKESVTLKIGPNLDEEMKSARLTMSGGQVKSGRNLEPGKKMTCYMRALFEYDPSQDTLLPCQDIGLQFHHGDILQIINVKDPNWWQAKHVGTEGPIGLIPSQELEERRKAYVHPEADYVHKISICGTKISKKKRKTMYKSKSNNDFDKADLIFYEEVTKMPPFQRRTLVLVGVQGVGRRTLKNRLINSDPTKFGTVTPHTTRPPRVLEENGKGYWFVDREHFEEELHNNNFLEHGEHNGNLYGTHLDSIRDVIKQNKMCVLDCAPSALKLLHNSQEFMPFVVFIAAPGMEQLKQIYAERRATGGSQRNLADDDLVQAVEDSALLQRKYEKYLDLVIVNEDFDITFRKVIEALDELAHSHQFVPVNWIY
ncbi:protein PALS2 isoform X2 [Lutzomyia longipalpis]|uniref:protein PALS2 isoform X2 n=1 Tax=Lutzomyia longipalpis TaxID=7200 RepID=UPI002483830F|nr:protein PALS2 isoform X2 [Lutzomyia longipalpis]XP_055684844.1 protein PALS2 isoform X2 [Lutzomyia longipalpis]